MQQYELAEQDYIAGMKYKDIAEKHGVTINTVKSWKTRYGWIRGDPSIHRSDTKKCVHTKEESVHTKEDKQEKGADGLNDRQRLFAVYYVKQHNATRAYLRAYGGTYEVAAVSAHNLLKNPKVKEFIDDLRKKQLEAVMIREEDLIQRYVDIMYADPLDYIDPKTGEARTNIVDGSLIASILPTKAGVAVRLPDKMKAMEKLQQYFDRQNAVTEEEEEDDNRGVILIGAINEDHMETASEATGISE